MIKLTEKDKEMLEQFPEYDNVCEHYVGSREYWENIFQMESNRDPELHTEFGELHEKIVNMVCQFCKENNLNDVDEFYITTNGLSGSIKFGEWCPCTDSSMTVYKKTDENEIDRETPFLHQI